MNTSIKSLTVEKSSPPSLECNLKVFRREKEVEPNGALLEPKNGAIPGEIVIRNQDISYVNSLLFSI